MSFLHKNSTIFANHNSATEIIWIALRRKVVPRSDSEVNLTNHALRQLLAIDKSAPTDLSEFEYPTINRISIMA